MKNNQNDLLKRAMEKIKCDEKYKPNYYPVTMITKVKGKY